MIDKKFLKKLKQIAVIIGNNRACITMFGFRSEDMLELQAEGWEVQPSETEYGDKYSVAKNRFGETDFTLFT